MPRPFKDLVVNETDGKARYRLVDDNGTVVGEAVLVEVASEVIQQGDKFGALAANRLLELDDDGTPLLKVDGGEYASKPGTIRLTRVPDGINEANIDIEPGEVMATPAGDLLVGDKNSKAVHVAQDKMPIAGGAFTGDVTVPATNTTGYYVRGIGVQTSGGTLTGTGRILMRRE